MWFLRTFYHSLFDIDWLRGQRGSAKAAWGYASLFIIVIAIIQILPVVLFAVPRGLQDVETTVRNDVPDFTAQLKGGVLTVTNLSQPFTREQTSDDINFRVVVDTVSTSSLSVGQFIKDKNRDVVILVTRSALSLYDGNSGQTDVENFSNSPDSTFTKTDLIGVFDKIKEFGVPLIQIIIALAFVVLTYVAKLFYLLILTLLVYVVARIRKWPWSYKELLTVGLFAITLPTLIQSIGRWFAWPLSPLYTLVFLFLMYAVMIGEKKNPPTGEPMGPVV